MQNHLTIHTDTELIEDGTETSLDSQTACIPDENIETAQLEAQRHFQSAAIKAYKTNKSTGENDSRIIEYLPMVQRIVGKIYSYADGSLSKEDLISAGTIGLVKAARDYDSTKDADFKTYAYIRVKGAVIDEFRKWTFVPNEVSKQVEQARQIAIQIQEETGRSAQDEEIAERMDISLERLMKVYESARNQHFLSMNVSDKNGKSLGESIFSTTDGAVGNELEKEDLIRKMAQAITELTDKAKKVIMLYYYQDLTMKEIAKVMEITESRVSQIHASAIFKLSLKMSGENDTG